MTFNNNNTKSSSKTNKFFEMVHLYFAILFTLFKEDGDILNLSKLKLKTFPLLLTF